MAGPVSIRLDEHLRRDLEEEATARGVPLASLIRDLLATAVRDARRQRIRECSAGGGCLHCDVCAGAGHVE